MLLAYKFQHYKRIWFSFTLACKEAPKQIVFSPRVMIAPENTYNKIQVILIKVFDSFYCIYRLHFILSF